MAKALPPPLPGPRTSLRRGTVALFLAPMAAIAPLGMMSLLNLTIGLGGGCLRPSMGKVLTDLTSAALFLCGTTFLLGLPTWAFLRLIRQESGRAYLAAGLLEGLFCGFYIALSNTGSVSTGQALGLFLVSLAGGAISWTFWRIARDPKDF